MGWKRMSGILRDKNDNVVIICSKIWIMRITGDSITVAPAMTLIGYHIQRMRDYADDA
jgi:carbamoylphosphate synthase large subunit